MPGEFTLRAVTHGKMDLIQAEAVRNFIDAQTDGQARTALRQMEGAVSKRLAPVKQRIVDLIAHLEAGIDFAEDDVELPDNTQIGGSSCSVLRTALEELQETYAYGTVAPGGSPYRDCGTTKRRQVQLVQPTRCDGPRHCDGRFREQRGMFFRNPQIWTAFRCGFSTPRACVRLSIEVETLGVTRTLGDAGGGRPCSTGCGWSHGL